MKDELLVGSVGSVSDRNRFEKGEETPLIGSGGRLEDGVSMVLQEGKGFLGSDVEGDFVGV